MRQISNSLMLFSRFSTGESRRCASSDLLGGSNGNTRIFPVALLAGGKCFYDIAQARFGKWSQQASDKFFSKSLRNCLRGISCQMAVRFLREEIALESELEHWQANEQSMGNCIAIFLNEGLLSSSFLQLIEAKDGLIVDLCSTYLVSLMIDMLGASNASIFNESNYLD